LGKKILKEYEKELYKNTYKSKIYRGGNPRIGAAAHQSPLQASPQPPPAPAKRFAIRNIVSGIMPAPPPARCGNSTLMRTNYGIGIPPTNVHYSVINKPSRSVSPWTHTFCLAPDMHKEKLLKFPLDPSNPDIEKIPTISAGDTYELAKDHPQPKEYKKTLKNIYHDDWKQLVKYFQIENNIRNMWKDLPSSPEVDLGVGALARDAQYDEIIKNAMDIHDINNNNVEKMLKYLNGMFEAADRYQPSKSIADNISEAAEAARLSPGVPQNVTQVWLRSEKVWMKEFANNELTIISDRLLSYYDWISKRPAPATPAPGHQTGNRFANFINNKLGNRISPPSMLLELMRTNKVLPVGAEENNSSTTSEFAKKFYHHAELHKLATNILKKLGKKNWASLNELLQKIKKYPTEVRPPGVLLQIEYFVTDQILNHNYNHRKIKTLVDTKNKPAHPQKQYIEYFIDNIYPRSCPKNIMTSLGPGHRATHSESRDWESKWTQLHEGHIKAPWAYNALHYGRKWRVIVPEGSTRGTEISAIPFGETAAQLVTVPLDWVARPGTGMHTIQVEGDGIEKTFVEDGRIDEQTWKDWWIFGYEHGLDKILRECEILKSEMYDYILTPDDEKKLLSKVRIKMLRIYEALKKVKRGNYMDSFTQKTINILQTIGRAARGTHGREIVAGVAGVALTGGLGVAAWLAAVAANYVATTQWDNHTLRHAKEIREISNQAHQSGYKYAYDLYTVKNPAHLAQIKKKTRPLLNSDIEKVIGHLDLAFREVVPAREVVEAQYDYTAQNVGELGFAEGDELELLQRTNDDWWRGRSLAAGAAGKPAAHGYFPAKYVRWLRYAEDGKSYEEDSEDEGSEEDSEDEGSEDEESPPRRLSTPAQDPFASLRAQVATSQRTRTLL
jgi:hypothetical protein